MKSVAKIILGFSLITLVACSGKGSGESRIHIVNPDEDDSPAVIDDDENHGSKSDKAACSFENGVYCAEAASSMKSECTSRGGKVIDECPASHEQCNFTQEGFEGVTFFVNPDLTTCETIQMMLSMDEDKDIYGEWED